VRRRALSERNKTFAMLCCYPWQALLGVLPFHLASLVAEIVFLTATGIPAKWIWQIYAGIPSAVWRQRPAIRALRNHLMSQRKATSKDFFAFTDWLPYKLRLLLKHGRPSLS